MARPLRLEYSGALYHVTSRGNARQAIVHDDDDRALFLEILGSVMDRFGWLCHAYCLMDNHYHLLIETPKPNLSQGMRQLNGVFTQKINRGRGRAGHLFQGRFKAILVERESYLLALARYVVLNPVRARMVKKAGDYRWSSYRATVGMTPKPSWLTTSSLLAQFGSSVPAARESYAGFVESGRADVSPWPELKGQVLLGSETFLAEMRARMGGVDHPEIPLIQRRSHRPSLDVLFPASESMSKVQRDEAIRAAFETHGYSMTAIARQTGLHYSTVSKIVKGVR
ncbi:MAG: addiction module toxin RelE [Alphaproteobacteria bacterium CG_4_10_14_0_2_um_filter_63_37]|nr:MAG: addiction module toxin RelE [Proteobacteria bacterium CG1_02_64_396]PJA25140.1 MAG: addiction module toxin RelE [Alphaproteobacteria bacterium CG_4_10_14_0_2_um_filter_63_37]